MNNRARYPAGIGAGRGGRATASPAFQSRGPQQQYLQRNFMQNQTQYPQQQYQQLQPQHHHHHHHHHQQQQQQQQQLLRRAQLGGGSAGVVDSSIEEVEKTVHSEAVDSRFS